MTLQELYAEKKAQNPALDLIQGIMRVTGKSANTARLWIKGMSVPSLTEREAIAKYTGIAEEDLFPTIKTATK